MSWSGIQERTFSWVATRMRGFGKGTAALMIVQTPNKD
jgi:hypothetical protein